jgi:hypothetical protein|tara:strand:- start:1125 stop:1289 length:165 start_codon:yes stop_codon:yes gene_type:complete
MNDNQINWLSDVYVQYCTDHNLPLLSADEQDLSSMSVKNADWITTFISIWEGLS